MRVAFLIVLVAAAIWYSYVAFADLAFMTRTGRLGPGFFPRIIGVLAVLMTLWALVGEVRARRLADGSASQWRDAVLLISLALGYAVLLRSFGGFVATFLFLAITLSVLNRGDHLRNALISVLVPAGVYLLFDRLLNANMPVALFPLPL